MTSMSNNTQPLLGEALGFVDDIVFTATHYYHSSSTFARLATTVLLVCFATSLLSARRPRVPGAKLHGFKGWWEPTFFLKTRFIYDAQSIINSGYAKFKDVPFVLRRHDFDIHVIPMKYMQELRLVPRKDFNAKMVHYENLFSSWPWASAIRDSDLHVAVLSRKLTPELGKYLDAAHEELEHGWAKDVPRPADWTEVDIQQSMRMLVARMSARVFVGRPACRDPTWLDVTINFSMDLFLAGFALRMFPPWTHFFVKPLIPARRRVKRQLDVGTEVVRDLMQRREERRKHQAERKPSDEVQREKEQEEETLFDWMVDHAVGKEGTLEDMAARQFILTLASIHTTATTASHVLFDMIAHPEWIEVLREEIDDTVREHGEVGENMSIKEWLKNLEKMDSFIVESQRMNPAILPMKPMVLKDGTRIPQGSRIAWPGPQHAHDPSVTPSPHAFDPMRSYRKRRAGRDGENMHRFVVGQTNPDDMSFGYGGQACPGRYFAAAEMKLLLMRLLREFDFAPSSEVAVGEGVRKRPRSITADENVILDPAAKVMMRRRRDRQEGVL